MIALKIAVCTLALWAATLLGGMFITLDTQWVFGIEPESRGLILIVTAICGVWAALLFD